MWTLLRYREAVSGEMFRVYGISWEEASGDTEPLERAQVAGQSPADFVDWFGRKFDLIPKSEW
jgi:hypothetical protein